MTTPENPDGSQPGQPPAQPGWGQPPQPGRSGPLGQQGLSWGPPGQGPAGQQPWGQPGPGPSGQPWGQPGQQGQPGQPWGQPGRQGQPWGAQTGSPAAAGQPWSGQQAFGQLDPKKAGPRTWLPIVGGVIVLLVVLGGLVSFFGAGEPEVGDCVQRTDTIEVVDCDGGDAQYRVVGIDDERDDLTQSEFYADDSTCSQFSGVTQQAWLGDVDDADSEGTIYCLGDV